MSVIIEIKDYSWQYMNTRQAALNDINVQVEEGMFVGIIGANGSGKTTLAYSLNGLIPGQYNGIKHGEVLIYGKEVEEYKSGELQKFTGMVFSGMELLSRTFAFILYFGYFFPIHFMNIIPSKTPNT